MSDRIAYLAGIFSGIVIILAIMGLTGEHNTFYQRGQVDCMNGKIMYDLEEQDDGTTQWKFKEQIINSEKG